MLDSIFESAIPPLSSSDSSAFKNTIILSLINGISFVDEPMEFGGGWQKPEGPLRCFPFESPIQSGPSPSMGSAIFLKHRKIDKSPVFLSGFQATSFLPVGNKNMSRQANDTNYLLHAITHREGS